VIRQAPGYHRRVWERRVGIGIAVSAVAACALGACTFFSDFDGLSSEGEPPAMEGGVGAPDGTTTDDARSEGGAGSGPLTAAEYRAFILSDSPAAYWRLADVAGQVAKDEVGGHSGTVTGAPDFQAEGPFLGGSVSMRFKGGEAIRADSFVNATTAAWTAYSVEAWVFPEVPAGSQGLIVEWFGNTAATSSSIAFGLFVDDATGALKVNIGPDVILTSSGGAATGKWKHGVVVVSGSNATFFVDGLLQSTLPSASIPARPAAGVFAIGADFDWGDGGLVQNAKEGFRGRIAEVAVYDHVLPPDRIAAHFRAR
jgi:hypothetical protein